jgi:hypothetical protein
MYAAVWLAGRKHIVSMAQSESYQQYVSGISGINGAINSYHG